MGLTGTLIWILAIVCAIWVIYDVANTKKMKKETKLVWIICAVLFSIITAIVYFFLVKNKK